MEAGRVADERGEARERLLARAADADEERAAARERKEARRHDAAEVLEGIVEEDEVHLEQLERLVEALHVLDGLLARVVEGLVHFGRRLRILVAVAQEVDVLLALELLDVGAELGGKRLQHDEDLLGEPRLVILVEELVREDAQLRHVALAVDLVRRGARRDRGRDEEGRGPLERRLKIAAAHLEKEVGVCLVRKGVLRAAARRRGEGGLVLSFLGERGFQEEEKVLVPFRDHRVLLRIRVAAQ